MLFHTWEFAVFFIVVFGVFSVLRFTSAWMIWLGAASYWFYAGWNPYYLGLIVYSTLLDFWVVQRMDACEASAERQGGLREKSPFGDARTSERGAPDNPSLFKRPGFWLIVSLVNNLGLLGFFKYADFCLQNINWVAVQLGVGWRVSSAAELMPFGWSYLLPVGISFYTFQSLSYTIDFYRGNIPRERSFLRFATFVAFFPQLVAGPIERSDNLLPQFAKPPDIGWQNISDGLSLFLVGLFKKVALANYLSLYVDRVYEQPSEFAGSALCLATFCFAWQIYFDFSGYTDMARGIARAMGFELMLNFRHPYLASSLADFWDRWHISLSTWFRDYVYIPLGGSRRNSITTYRNLFLVFVISGFWHGSAWQFIAWGLLHGLGLCATRLLERQDWYQRSMPIFAKQMIVFLFVCFGWIFFRAESMSEALLILRGIPRGLTTDPGCPYLLLGMVLAVWSYQRLCESSWRPRMSATAFNLPLAVGMLGYLLLCAAGGGEFIYFQF